MRTPKFWQSKNLLSTILLPLGALYAFLTKLRVNKKTGIKISKPVICVGNITAGGTGKTPVAIALSQILQEHFYTPYFISRGYGGRLTNVLIDLKTHSAKDVGDEPMLLANHCPTIINPHRGVSAQKAVELGADVVIMDDGFQNPGLEKDISFIVFDGGYGWGNKRCIPAGPLREKWYRGSRRANAVIIIGEDKFNLAAKVNDKPVFFAKIEAVAPNIKNKNIIAFAGIGRPQKFYDSLVEQGFMIKHQQDFPDHHQYSQKDLQNLIDVALLDNLDIWTTSKDFIKIPKGLQKHFNVLEIAIKWQNKSELENFLLSLVKKV